MDTLKREIPIWKREIYADGMAQWVHPVEPVADPKRDGGGVEP
jgi:molybdopterin synthase catalytic subunit